MARTNNRFHRFWEWQKRDGEERPVFWGWITGGLLAVLSYLAYVIGGDGDPYLSLVLASMAGLVYGRYSVYMLKKQEIRELRTMT